MVISDERENGLKTRNLLYNGNIHTQASGLIVDSMATQGNKIIAIGNSLQHDPDFKSYAKIDLKKRMVIPGLVDAHTHFYYWAVSLGRVQLEGLTSLDACLKKIKQFAARQPKDAWIVGDGYAPDRFRPRTEPDRYMLDKVTGGRPAFIFSHDQHSAWVNSRALEIADIRKTTPDPVNGTIERLDDRTPSGILREHGAYSRVWEKIPRPSSKDVDRRWPEALKIAYSRGVTGVHSFDSPEALAYMTARAEKGTVGLRIEHYPSAKLLPNLQATKTYYGIGTPFFRIAGVKIFADGSLGSQTALCFQPYAGSKKNYGIATVTVKEIVALAHAAARLHLPCAVHAIGDKAVANVLDALEQRPELHFGARHRIEHVQLLRRSDIARFKKLNIVASMQPSHCTADIDIVRTYWGSREKNAYLFKTLLKNGIHCAYGSDAPIEPLNPLEGIEAAVRRARPRSNDVFYPSERLTPAEALFGFTAGAAYAAGQEHCRGYLLPGYPADYVVLAQDITKIPASKIGQTNVLATVLDGKLMFADRTLRW
jgi:predicted amidohydrolase YtcJ